MDVAAARALLGVHPAADLDQVERAFRAAVHQAHPDHGGDAERFHRAVAARDVLRRQLGGAVGHGALGRPPVVVVHRRSMTRRLFDGLERRPRPSRVI